MKLASRLRALGPTRLVAPLAVVLLGVTGYVVVNRLQERDRTAEAMRRAQVVSVGAQGVLAGARSFVASLGSVLAGEPVRDERRFASLTRGAAGSVGLIDVLWVQSVTGAGRAGYERRLGAPITRLTGVRGAGASAASRFVDAPPAAAYLPATFTSETRPELRPGVDVSTWAALAAAIRNRANVFAVSASLSGSLGGDPGFYVLEAEDYGSGSGSHGFLAVFVPRGWLTRPLADDPRTVALYLGGRRLEGDLTGPASGSTRFQLLGREWRIAAGKPALTAWQSAAPWIALTWPLAFALLIWVVGRGIVGRRRAEAEFERMFQVSRDLLWIAGLDGGFRRVNPAFERTLGYSGDELHSLPIETLVDPADRGRVREALAQLADGEEVVELEVRVARADGVVRRLELNARPISGSNEFYAAARDVTDRRRTERELEVLAQEQAALRRVATLVARGAAPNEVLEAVVAEARRLLTASSIRLYRYEGEGRATVIASSSEPGMDIAIGTTLPLEGDNVPGLVWRTRRAARIERLDAAAGPLAARMTRMGIHAGAGAPISVEGRIWGVLVAGWETLIGLEGQTGEPVEAEARLSAFTELVATAVSNTEASDRVRRLAEEQAALRRVATLVAEGATTAVLGPAVVEEVVNVLNVPSAWLIRYLPDRMATAIASTNDPAFPVGSVWPLEGSSATEAVFATGRPARIDNFEALPGAIAGRTREAGFQSAAAVPITVDASVWGAVCVATTDSRPLPDDIVPRLSGFTELIATAVSSANAREGLRRLAEEQAALRRVATLVAEAPASMELFAAVTEEAVRLLDVPVLSMTRFEEDGTATVIAASAGAPFPVGTNLVLDGPSVIASILETGYPARINDHTGLPGGVAAGLRAAAARSAFGSPIVVDGRVWGAIAAIVSDDSPVPADAESRLSEFTELIATAISNAATRAQLLASRARIVAAGDEARRRIERNLHDGTQQRLIVLGLDLQRIRATVPKDQEAAHSGLERVERDLESVLEDVRELSRGLHPALLLRGGLPPALRELARRSPIPVHLDVDLAERPPPTIEAAVYYIISEAFTNAIKHSQASTISVAIATDRSFATLRGTIADDGVGGAEPTEGSGLMGAIDRVDALGGRFVLESRPGQGTTITIELPIGIPEEPLSAPVTS